MKYNISADQIKKATHPHEIFLINLVFNHIFVFVVGLSVVRTFPILLGMVPILSVSVLSYTLWRAKRSLQIDPWYVMCHWQISARWTRLFALVLGVLGSFLIVGTVLRAYFNFSEIMVYAVLGGFGLLPTMICILILIAIESDALHQARHGILPDWATARYLKITEEVE
ncbi:conserved membrane hypothetical protein [Gammaproteobacteria bacterium]